MGTRIYAVDKITSYIGNPLIRSFHAVMFHGLAERDGAEYPLDPKVWAETSDASSLDVSRSGTSVPELSQPSSHFVVSARIAELLADLPHLRIVPVRFKRLVDIEYVKGDMTWVDKWGQTHPRDLLRTLPDVRRFHESIGTYFEVRTFRLQDVVDARFRETVVDLPRGTAGDWAIECLSPEVFAQHPILWSGETLLSESAFSLLDQAIDRTYFDVREHPH